jgi:hypothetical protein
VFVGKEEDLVPLRKGPLEDRAAIGGGADGASALAAVRFDLGGRVHVGDGHHRGESELLQGGARLDHVVRRRHVGHGAARVEIGQHDRLVGLTQDVGALRHEVDAAEDDPTGVRPLGAEPGELVRVAGDVGVLDHVVPLVVMPQHDERAPKARLGLADARRQDGVVQLEIGLGYGQDAGTHSCHL